MSTQPPPPNAPASQPPQPTQPNPPAASQAQAGSAGTGPALLSGRVRLYVAAGLFVLWIAWLGYTALTKSRAPVVSRAQAAVATVPVRAKLPTGSKATTARYQQHGAPDAETLRGDDNKPAFVVTVVEQLTPNGPAKDAQIGVGNIHRCGGFAGDGEYLLLLVRDDGATIDGHPAYLLVGYQRSPGADIAPGDGPPIYPWTDKTGDDLRQQVKSLFP